MTVTITPLSRREKAADFLMIPAMKLLMLMAGHPRESLQRTHFWNNWKGPYDFDQSIAIKSEGVKGAPNAGGLRRHLPPPFGWQHYLVLQRADRDSTKAFHVGWVGGGVSGISRIQSHGQVRVLEGPSSVVFTGFNPDGTQIGIEQIGQGQLGDKKWQDIALL